MTPLADKWQAATWHHLLTNSKLKHLTTSNNSNNSSSHSSSNETSTNGSNDSNTSTNSSNDSACSQIASSDVTPLADKYDKQQRDAATWQWDDISTRKNWKNCYNYRSCYSCCCCCCSCCTRPSPAYPTLPQLLHTSKVPFPVARSQKISRPEYAKKPLFGVDAGIILRKRREREGKIMCLLVG